MSSNNQKPGVKNVERRTWDVSVYEAKAAARRQQESDAKEEPLPHNNSTSELPEFQPAAANAAGPQGSQRAFLKARKSKLQGFDDQVGKTALLSVEDATQSSNTDGVRKVGVGWHCTVCNVYLKDSHTYLDHINGRKHQKKLGFSMRVERSSETDVLSRLQALQQQKQLQATKQEEVMNFHQKVQEKDALEQQRKVERARKRKERRQKAKQQETVDSATEPDNPQEDEQQPEINPDLAAMMGFSGFGGTSNKL